MAEKLTKRKLSFRQFPQPVKGILLEMFSDGELQAGTLVNDFGHDSGMVGK
jgi:hypothetical protein